MLNLHTAPANGQLGGYEEVNPPMLVRDEAMFGTGQLPKFEDDLCSNRHAILGADSCSAIRTGAEYVNDRH
jgi:seryl-tRNA synthetase